MPAKPFRFRFHFRFPFRLAASASALALGLLACGGRDAQEGSTPALYHDFGTLLLGQSKEHVFEIPIPQGEGRVMPGTFTGDCSCAVGLLMIKDQEGETRPVYGLYDDEKRSIQAGESVILRLSLVTKEKEPVDLERTLSRGNVSFTHVAKNNAIHKTFVPLSFHYGIKSPVKVSPVAHVDFGDLPLVKTFSQVLTLESNRPLHVLCPSKVQTSNDRLQAYLEQSNGKHLLHIKVTPNEDFLGPYAGEVSLSTGLQDYPDLRLRVSGMFINTIKYESGNVLAFNLFDFGQKKELFLNLTDYDDRRPAGFVLHSILDDNDADIAKHFRVRFQSLQERTVRVFVEYLGTMQRNTLYGQVKLAKAEGEEPVAWLRMVGHNSKRK